MGKFILWFLHSLQCIIKYLDLLCEHWSLVTFCNPLTHLVFYLLFFVSCHLTMSIQDKTSMFLIFKMNVLFALCDKLEAAAASTVTGEPWLKGFAEAVVCDLLWKLRLSLMLFRLLLTPLQTMWTSTLTQTARFGALWQKPKVPCACIRQKTGLRVHNKPLLMHTRCVATHLKCYWTIRRAHLLLSNAPLLQC